MSIFSKNLRHLRESRGLKLDEFEFLGIKKGTMSNYELGNTEPKLSLLCEISKFFRISIDDFLLKDIEAEKITPVVTETAPPETANNNFRELLDVLREKDSTIREMAEEIGMLKQTITQLKQDKSGRVSDAGSSTLAGAG
ncbi:helix-turn-helix domain-containing protein [Bacteroides faecis]|uniref:helix-turn-helix domain-containing protein n=1 Tax=Bacteroides faecis TaxID=674529 RepID=UPI00189D0E6B|nr:helix-turn-helix transcriptional regulator [Bacteroides faecis]